MPDLTIESAWTCASNTSWETKVEGQHGTYTVRWERDHRPNAPYQYRYVCDCRGFHFRGACAHLGVADQRRCKWNEALEPSAPARYVSVGDARPEPRCPKCGGPLDAYRVAV